MKRFILDVFGALIICVVMTALILAYFDVLTK